MQSIGSHPCGKVSTSSYHCSRRKHHLVSCAMRISISIFCWIICNKDRDHIDCHYKQRCHMEQAAFLLFDLLQRVDLSVNPSEKSGPYNSVKPRRIPPDPSKSRKISGLPKKSPFYAWRWLCSCAHPTSRSYNLSTTYCCHLHASNTLSSCSNRFLRMFERQKSVGVRNIAKVLLPGRQAITPK